MRIRALALIGLFLLAACGREGAPLVSPSPTPRPSPTAEAEETAEPEESPDATATPTASPTPTASASPTAEACRNSTQPACGAFRFDPAFDDEQVTVEVTVSPRNPKVGEQVTFSLEATDPDSKDVFLGTYRFGRDEPGSVADDFPGECPRAYGPWDAPEEEEGSSRQTLRHKYREAGEHKALFSFYSHTHSLEDHPWPDKPPGDEDGLCVDPGASAGKVSITVRVEE